MEKEFVYKNNKSAESVNSTANVTRRILSMDGNALRISLVSLFTLSIAFAVLVVCSFPTSFFLISEDAEFIPYEIELVSMLVTASLMVCGAFILCPIFSGVLRFVDLTVDGKQPKFVMMFSCFRGAKRYFNSILLPLVMLIRIMLVLVPLAGGIMFIPMTEIAEQPLMFFTLAKVVFLLFATLAATAVGMYISSFLYFVPYLVTAHNYGIFSAITASIHLSRGRKAELLRMSLRSMWYATVGALSLFVAWVIYGMPKTSVSYFVYCNEVIRAEISTDE